jgi:hypothetical protein
MRRWIMGEVCVVDLMGSFNTLGFCIVGLSGKMFLDLCCWEVKVYLILRLGIWLL